MSTWWNFHYLTFYLLGFLRGCRGANLDVAQFPHKLIKMTKINGQRWPVRTVSDVAPVKPLVASMATDPLYPLTFSIIGLWTTLCTHFTDFAPALVVRHSPYRLCPCLRSATRLVPLGRGTSLDASWSSPHCRRPRPLVSARFNRRCTITSSGTSK